MTTSNRKQTSSSSKGEKPKIKRSRNGCHNCKRLKIKCDEEKPRCSYCIKTDSICDYSIKLTWGGRPYKNSSKLGNVAHTKGAVNPGVDKLLLNFKQSPIKDEIQFIVESKAVPYAQDNTNKRIRNSYLSSTNSNTENPSKKIRHGSSNEKSSRENSGGAGSPNFSNTSHINLPSSFITPTGDSILSGFNTFAPNGPLQSFNDLPYLYSNLDSTNDGNSIMCDPIKSAGSVLLVDKSAGQVVKSESPKEESLNSIIDSMPEISSGIESVSNEVERITGGEYHLNLKNSGIFNNFVLSNLEENAFSTNKSPRLNGITSSESFAEKVTTPWSPASDLNINGFGSKLNDSLPNGGTIENEFNDYSADLARIESYLPERQKSNLLADVLSLSNSSSLFAYNIGSSNKKIIEIDEDENFKNGNQLFGVEFDDNSTNDSQISRTPAKNEMMSPSYMFESIPPLLVPLPEILLEVPFYRNLMHFWVNVASENLVPAPSYIYSDNPFKILLPQMAMEYPSILTTLLAFAAAIRSLLIGPENTPKEVVDQLLARSCNELLNLLKDKEQATSDGALATILLLSCYESILSNDFDKHRTHALGARQIVIARRCLLPRTSSESDKSSSSSTTSSQSSPRKESDIAFFLLRWFIYVDVMGALSATKNSHKYLTSEDGYYEPIDSVASLADFDNDDFFDIDRKNDIDHLLGFDIRVLPQLTDIALLIRKTELYFRQNGVDGKLLPISIITRALEIKESITTEYEKGEARRQEKLDTIIDYKTQRKKETLKTDSPPNLNNIMQQYNILRATNKIFCDMGILNLYRRVLCVPRESPIIQKLANGIGLILESNIESRSSAEICSIFCFFCAGCETLDPHMRSLFYDRFTNLTEMGNPNAKKSLQIMTRCWETGEDWIVASNKLDIDIALL